MNVETLIEFGELIFRNFSRFWQPEKTPWNSFIPSLSRSFYLYFLFSGRHPEKATRRGNTIRRGQILVHRGHRPFAYAFFPYPDAPYTKRDFVEWWGGCAHADLNTASFAPLSATSLHARSFRISFLMRHINKPSRVKHKTLWPRQICD